MFAKGSSNADYHLLRADEEQTLCGRIVAPIIIDQPVKSSHLHLTTTTPSGLQSLRRLRGAKREGDGWFVISLKTHLDEFIAHLPR